MSDCELEIYIDGSAITNPGSQVGCAGIVRYPNSLCIPDKKLKWPYSTGTSGSMEILALVNALKWVNSNLGSLSSLGISSVAIYSDSDYVVQSANVWIRKWSDPWNKNKWKKSNGGTVKHESLWKEFLRQRKKLPWSFGYSLEWIEGKSTVETKGVDKAAKEAARSIVKKPNFDQMPYKQGRSLLGKKSSLELFSKKSGIYLIRVYSHHLVSRKKNAEYEVRFEVIKEDCIEGRFKAFTSQEIGFGSIDRGNYYNASFNDDMSLPWITKIESIESAELQSLKEKVKLMKRALNQDL